MTGLGQQMAALLRLTLEDPRAGVRSLLDMGIPLPARTAGLLLTAVVSALLLHVSFLILPPTGQPAMGFLQASPIRSALVQWLILVLSVLLIYRVGRSWGGTGSLPDALLIVVWLQLIMLGVQILQLVLLIVAPPLMGIVSLGGLVLFFWLAASFIAELHGFRSRWAVLAGIFATSIATALVLVLVLSLFVDPGMLQGV